MVPTLPFPAAPRFPSRGTARYPRSSRGACHGFRTSRPCLTTTKRSSPTCRRRRSSITTTSTIRPTSPTATTCSKGSGLEDKSLEEVVKQSYSKNAGLFNNAGQHYNHIHFWKWMKKGGGGKTHPRRARQGDRLRSRRLRQVPHRFHPGRRHPVRLRLGLGRRSATASCRSRRRRTARTRSSTAARRSSASMCGSTPTTSTTATLRPKYLEAFVDNLINWDYVLELYEKARG